MRRRRSVKPTVLDMSEVSLAKHVIAWCVAHRWEVYQEVTFRGARIDIVCTRGPVVAVIECKRSFGQVVLEQAYKWLPFAHMVWVATWGGGSRGHLSLVERLALHFGIGHLEVTGFGHVNESTHPTFRRTLAKAPVLRDVLRPEHQQGYAQAGSNRGRQYTPWADTCAQLRKVVESQPGIAFREALSKVKHHYKTDASARSALSHWLQRGRVRGIRVQHDGRFLTLHPVEVLDA